MKDGSVWSGNFVGGLRDGFGVESLRDGGGTLQTEYRNGIQEGVSIHSYPHNEFVDTKEFGRGLQEGLFERRYSNRDCFLQEYKNGKACDRGVYIQKSTGVAYKGKMSRKTSAVWAGVGSVWGAAGDVLALPGHNPGIINSFASLVGFTITFAAASVTTIGAAVASPFTGAVDKVKRARNKIQLSGVELASIATWRARVAQHIERRKQFFTTKERLCVEQRRVDAERRQQMEEARRAEEIVQIHNEKVRREVQRLVELQAREEVTKQARKIIGEQKKTTNSVTKQK